MTKVSLILGVLLIAILLVSGCVGTSITSTVRTVIQAEKQLGRQVINKITEETSVAGQIASYCGKFPTYEEIKNCWFNKAVELEDETICDKFKDQHYDNYAVEGISFLGIKFYHETCHYPSCNPIDMGLWINRGIKSMTEECKAKVKHAIIQCPAKEKNNRVYSSIDEAKAVAREMASKVRAGMHFSEVHNILGKADFSAGGSLTYYFYVSDKDNPCELINNGESSYSLIINSDWNSPDFYNDPSVRDMSLPFSEEST